jgi:hypothetical protein
MLLCEEGRAGIDDLVGQYLPEMSAVTRQVTIRQLMGHVHGLRDAYDIRCQFSGTGRMVSIAELLSLYRDIDDMNAAPDVTWNYNNGGYMLLSLAIERITGQSLEDVMRERIFAPIGMYDTLLRRFDTDFVPNSATLHMSKLSGGFERSYVSKEHIGEGGMVSTVDDLLRWLAHMDAPVIGSAVTWRLMKAAHRLSNGASTGYGLGLITDRYRGVETLSHAGGLMGCNSHMLKVPAAGLDVVILVNRHDVSAVDLVNRTLDACLQGLDPVKEPFSGPFITRVFHSPTTGRVIQLYAKEGQQIASINGGDMAVIPDDDGVLRPVGSFSPLKLTVSLVGDPTKPTSIRFNYFGNLDELIAIEPIQSPDVAAIAGKYRSDPTGTEVTISNTDDGARLHAVGRFGSQSCSLECLGAGIWRTKSKDAMPWGGTLVLDSDGGAFRYSTGSTWALPFRRCV